jgi:hypothetical protein
MTKENLINKFVFEQSGLYSESKASHYIDVKGVALHLRIANYIGFCEDGKVEYALVSSLLRYDKKLRDKLYIFLATFEEYVRAFISNKYEEAPSDIEWADVGKRGGQFPVESAKMRINNGELPSRVLDSLEFGELLKQVELLPESDKIELFGYTKNLADNLRALKQLRNLVSHHVFLLKDADYIVCTTDITKDDTLENNIRNLRQYLPRRYFNGLTKNINDAIYEAEEKNGMNTGQRIRMRVSDVFVVNI